MNVGTGGSGQQRSHPGGGASTAAPSSPAPAGRGRARGFVAQPVPPPAGQFLGPSWWAGALPSLPRLQPSEILYPPKRTWIKLAKSSVTAEAVRCWMGSNEPLRPSPEESDRGSFV